MSEHLLCDDRVFSVAKLTTLARGHRPVLTIGAARACAVTEAIFSAACAAAALVALSHSSGDEARAPYPHSSRAVETALALPLRNITTET